MIVKAENPSQIKVSKNIINVSLDIVIYSDDSGTELHRERISANANIADTNVDDSGKKMWIKHLLQHLIKEKKKIVNKFKEINTAILDVYPDASSAEDALTKLAKEVENG